MKIEHLFLTADHLPIEADPSEEGSASAGPAPSPLRDYVLFELPADLRAVSDGDLSYRELCRKQEFLLRGVAAQIAGNEDPRTARLIQLDLLFLLGGYLPATPGTPTPDGLTALIEDQCARFRDLDDHMSYELIIDVNCAEFLRRGDIRVYSDGATGRHERDFYLGHFLAEPFARSAAYRLHDVVNDPAGTGVAESLAAAAQDLGEFKLAMGRYARLPKPAFAYFRQYLTSYSGGARGASGAFMPSVQMIELSLLRPTGQYNVYLDESMAYFPSWSRPEIAKWRAESSYGRNLTDLIDSGRLAPEENAGSALLQILDHFIDFRMVHLGVTRTHIPEAFRDRTGLTRKDLLAQHGEQDILDDAAKGTSGFSVRNVLTNAVHRLLVLRRHIAAKSC